MNDDDPDLIVARALYDTVELRWWHNVEYDFWCDTHDRYQRILDAGRKIPDKSDYRQFWSYQEDDGEWQQLPSYSNDDGAALAALHMFCDKHDLTSEYVYFRTHHGKPGHSVRLSSDNVNGGSLRGQGDTFGLAACDAMCQGLRAIDDRWIGWRCER